MAKKTTKSTKAKAAPADTGKAARRYVSAKIPIKPLDGDFSRADLIFDGLDHSGPSYEGRVFLNNEGAHAGTPTTPEHGYAGSFHIFGHGGCYGSDITHCQLTGPRRPYDPRPGHPLTPARKIVIATDALKLACAKSGEMTVTIVPVVYDASPKADYSNVVKLEGISVAAYT
jgi:tyrosinase